MIRPALLALASMTLLASPSMAQQTTMANDSMHAMHHPMTPAHDSVLAVVKRLFDGMRTRDTALIRSTFAPGALLGGVPSGTRPVRFTTIDAFVGSIGSAAPGAVYDEQIYDPEIRIDGGLATVWTFYTFSVGEKLSHCGMDAFQMVRTSGGWKITALADTRQMTGCEVTGKKKA